MNRIIVILCFILPLSLSGQVKLPFSRTDSAELLKNDTLYRFYLNQGDLKEASRHLDNNAILYWKHFYYEKAIEYFQKSLELNKKLGNFNGIAGINSNLALIYADKQDYQKAYEYFEKTLAVRKSHNEPIGIISALINESVVLNNLGKYDMSVKKLEEALTYAKEMNDEKQMRSIFGMLSETYQKAGNFDKARYYYEYYRTFNEYVTEKEIQQKEQQLKEEKLKRKILALENQNKELKLKSQKLLIQKQKNVIGKITKEQQKLIDSLDEIQMSKKIIEQRARIKELENKRLKEQKRKQSIIIFIVSSALVVVVVLLVLVYRLMKQKDRLNKILISKNTVINQQKAEIETQMEALAEAHRLLQIKNQEITDSINYARRIQQAILSASNEFSQIFKESFLIYIPKYIVSGDFYYFRNIGTKNVIIIGDCTGHGVPGAFLTIMAINLLDEIILEKKVIEPSQILIELDKQFNKMLNPGNEVAVSDGMDVAICVVDKREKKIVFAGAKNGLIIVNDEGLKEIKGTRLSIGIKYFYRRNLSISYSSQALSINKQTWIYMFSDGITDLFNKDRKKYGKKKLKENIAKVWKMPAKEQKEFFLREIKQWKGTVEQTDDIILFGFMME